MITEWEAWSRCFGYMNHIDRNIVPHYEKQWDKMLDSICVAVNLPKRFLFPKG